VIDRFKNEFVFLSNFWPATVVFEGVDCAIVSATYWVVNLVAFAHFALVVGIAVFVLDLLLLHGRRRLNRWIDRRDYFRGGRT